MENKIKHLHENLKILENNENSRIELNNSLGSKDVIDENIKKAKLKELKTKKDILEKKLSYLDNKLKLISREEEIEINFSKFDIKKYLDNFEKDTKEAELREQKWKHDHVERARKFEEEHNKMAEKIKEKIESDEILNNQKRQENYHRQLEKIKNKNHLFKDDITKLNEKKDEWKSNPVNEKEYFFKINEENFKKKEIEENEEKKNKMISELAKKKVLFQPLTKLELNEYRKKFDENKKMKDEEKQKERVEKKQELIQKNSSLPKADNKVYVKIVEEDKKTRENREKEKLDRVYNSMKIKQFSKVVLKNMVPKVDEEKINELKERVNKIIVGRPKKLEKSKLERIILKKPDPDKPRKYKWDIKLDEINLAKQNDIKKPNKRVLSQSTVAKKGFVEDIDDILSINKISNSKRIPMIKNPDYLTQIRNEKSKKAKKGLETDFDNKESKHYD